MESKIPVILMFFLLVSLSGAAAGESVHWPLDLAPQVSATFMEFRGSRFHAGLDLRTNGKVGQAVRAPFDGWVQRIRITETGYGRMLELANSAGIRVRFAHLESYDENELGLESRVLKIRRGRFARYPIDLAFADGEIPVRRGMIVARSGDSGAGPAHLHLEWRAAGQLLDPLDHFSRHIPDSTAPRFTRLYLLPVGPTDRVGGVSRPLEFPLPVAGPLRIAVAGSVDLRVAALDRMDGVANRLGPREIELSVDGSIHTLLRFDRISADRLGRGGDVFDVARSSLGQGHYVYCLTARTAGHSPQIFRAASGVLRVDRPRQLVLKVRDRSGNEAVQRLELVPPGDAPPADLELKSGGSEFRSSHDGRLFWDGLTPGSVALTAGRWQKYGGKNVPAEYWFLSSDGLCSGPFPTHRPVTAPASMELSWEQGQVCLELKAPAARSAFWIRPEGDSALTADGDARFFVHGSPADLPCNGIFRFRCLQEDGSEKIEEFSWQGPLPDQVGWQSPDGGLRLQWAVDSLAPGSRILLRRRKARAGKGWKTVAPFDWCLRVLPPPGKPLRVVLMPADPADRARLCRVDGRETLLDARKSGEGGWEFTCTGSLDLGWRRDDNAPRLQAPRHLTLSPQTGEARVRVKFFDAGSGVERSGVRWELDGQARDFDFSAEDGWIELPVYPWDRPGNHQARLWVRDRSGMESVWQGSLQLTHRVQGDTGSGRAATGDFPRAKRRKGGAHGRQ